MGANQSSYGGGGSGGSGPDTKTCYYELLGIERQASEEECVFFTVELRH